MMRLFNWIQRNHLNIFVALWTFTFMISDDRWGFVKMTLIFMIGGALLGLIVGSIKVYRMRRCPVAIEVLCQRCVESYNTWHSCDAPDFCMCDNNDLHI